MEQIFQIFHVRGSCNGRKHSGIRSMEEDRETPEGNFNVTTFGLREPREDIRGEIQRFLVRIATAPFVINGHLKAVPPRKHRRNSHFEAGD